MFNVSDSNPLILPILYALKQSSKPITEHQLFGLLELPFKEINSFSQTPQLALFQQHFLVMNALYQLQESVSSDGYFLAISPLSISLLPHDKSHSKEIVDDQSEQALRQYYLDWENFKNTSEEDVESMLDGFWQRYIANDKKQEAFQLLGVSQGMSWSEIQNVYRKKIAAKHPDKGGSAEEFIPLREAYEIVARIHRQ